MKDSLKECGPAGWTTRKNSIGDDRKAYTDRESYGVM